MLPLNVKAKQGEELAPPLYKQHPVYRDYPPSPKLRRIEQFAIQRIEKIPSLARELL